MIEFRPDRRWGMLILLAIAVVFRLNVTLPTSKAASGNTYITDFKIKGVTFFDQWQGAYISNEANTCINLMPNYGIDWVSIIVTWYQDTIDSTSICFRGEEAGDWRSTQTDEEVASIINLAHSKGMKVMLKPHVSPRDGNWRGLIGSNFDESDWQAWFPCYKNFINHYAQVAQENSVELFSFGTELRKTAHRETEWRQVIAGVRQRYSGPITYAASHSGEEVQIQWWDAVDYIGVDAYYPLTNRNDPTVAELKAAWQGPLQTLRDLSNQWGKQIIFTEIGYTSSDGTNRYPWDEVIGGQDLQEQVDCYQAAFETFWNEPWFGGMFWWDTESDNCEMGSDDTSYWLVRGYTPLGKPAGEIMRTWYQAVSPTPTPEPSPTTATPTLTHTQQLTHQRPHRHRCRPLPRRRTSRRWPTRAPTRR